MNVIIPTAGMGTRLRPHTHTRPKPLVPVAGKPVLGHVLDRLQVLSIDTIVFITGYLGDQIEDYVSTHYELNAQYIEQKELLGQAHAIALAKGQLHGPTLILFVDTIFEADLEALNRTEHDGVIYVSHVDDPSRFGVVVEEGGNITRLVEKPSTPISHQAVIGLYYVREVDQLFEAIDTLIERNIQTKGEFYLADALQLMIDSGCAFKAEQASVWEDCGTVDAILRTNRFFLERGAANQPDLPGVVVVPPVFVAPTARIERSVIGPHVSVGDGVAISDSVIRDSIISERATITTTILGGSLIGEGAQVEGHHRSLNIGDSSVISER